MSKNAIRIDAALLRDAEAEAKLMHRSAPKQIEYWASIGRELEKLVDSEALLKVRLGLASLRLEVREAAPVTTDAVHDRLTALRESGELSRRIAPDGIAYEASGEPGLLYRVHNGQRERGRFVDGEFIAQPSAS